LLSAATEPEFLRDGNRGGMAMWIDFSEDKKADEIDSSTFVIDKANKSFLSNFQCHSHQ